MASAKVGAALRFIAGLMGGFALVVSAFGAVDADVDVDPAFLTGPASLTGAVFDFGLTVRGSLAGWVFAAGFTAGGFGATTFVASTTNS